MVRLFLVTVLTSLTSALPGFAEHDPLVDHPMLLSSAQAVRSMETGRDLLLRFRLDESEAVMQRLAGEQRIEHQADKDGGQRQEGVDNYAEKLL